jgi:hypothetical protein
MQALPVRAVMRALARSVIVLLLATLTLVSSGWSRPQPSAANRLAPTQPAPGGGGALQEVAPPAAVQELAERLAARNPRVEIVAPADDSLLPDGPWTLQLRVSDWPLADAGPLGLGPHLVVQLDQQPPLRISSSTTAAELTMEPLLPGSHRLTVYAARPWGEAVKSPGAFSQIRLHRVGRNAAELPARGSAQLIAASPDGLQQDDPVLIDWLLLDAPLQHLRDDDARWRLRVSVNGDSFLVDRQTPLWLKGFRRGSNAVQLELLDGRGDPLNPPFNSLVREVVIGGGNKPGWRRSTLSAAELASLSGEPTIPAAPTAKPEILKGVAEPAPAEATPSPPIREETPAAEPAAAPLARAAIPAPASIETQRPPSPSATPAAQEAAAVAATEAAGEAAGESVASAADSSAPTPAALKVAAEPTEQPAAAPPPTPPQAAEPAQTQAIASAASSADQPSAASSAKQPSAANEPSEPSPATSLHAQAPDRVAPTSSLAGSARELVNADGSLVKPKRQGPLAGLREKLGG